MALTDKEKRNVILRILQESKLQQSTYFVCDNDWFFNKLNNKNIRIGQMFGIDIILKFK